MLRLVASFAVVLGLASGCKGGGFGHAFSGFASGLGKVASGVGKVASGVGRVAGHAAAGVAKVGPAIAHGAAKAAPAVGNGLIHTSAAALDIGETVAEAMLLTPMNVDLVERIEPVTPVVVDPCIDCPLDDACETCAGFADQACAVSPAGALARCESTAPPPLDPED